MKRADLGTKIGLGVVFAVLVSFVTAGVAKADTYLFGFGSGAQSLTVTLTGGTMVTFTTDMSEFNAGTPNQGWWSPVDTNLNNNDNYGVGTSATDPADHHSFFTFDLRGFTGVVVSATLNLQRFCGNNESGGLCGRAPGGPVTLPFNLWDVSTDAATLNAKVNNPNFAIYTDLGSGINYGMFVLPTSGNPNDILNFNLDAAGVAAINAGEGGFFSIGGAIPLSALTPEPSSVILLGSGVLGLVGVARRKLQQ